MVDEDKRNRRQIVYVVENWLYGVENISNEVQECKANTLLDYCCHCTTIINILNSNLRLFIYTEF